MGFASFFLLAIALLWLWRRVRTLEQQVARLRDVHGVLPRPATPASLEHDDPAFVAPPMAAGPLVPGPDAVELPPNPATDPAPGRVAEAAREGWRPRFDFEDLFGRMLPIWTGGITLAVAGFFLVRWSIERGLLTPGVRVVLAGLFGIALLAAAEGAWRWRERVADPRVAQALGGAGLATLYAAFYLAGSTYGLIAPALAFVGLAGVTGAAIALSFRFGLPSAVLGLVGGFAAPALVGNEQANIGLLTIYLALLVGGLAFAGKRRGYGWLGLAALAGGLGWGGILVTQGPAADADRAVLGTYLVLLGGIMPALVSVPGTAGRALRTAAIAMAAVQLAAIVATGGFGALEWGLYLVLGAALGWFGWRDRSMREGGAVAAAVGVLLALAWPAPDRAGLALVEAGLVLVFAGVPLARILSGRGTASDAAQACGIALGGAAALHWHFAALVPAAPHPLFALWLALLAIVPGVAAWRGPAGWPRILAQAVCAWIGYAAFAQVIPGEALAWLAALLAAGFAWRARALTGAVAMLTAIAAAWAAEPAARWLAEGAKALVGTPMLTADLPGVKAVILRLVPVAAAAAAWRALAPPPGVIKRVVEAVAIAAGTVAAHALYRHAFAAIASGDFAATGVMERAVWEAMLVGAGWLALRRGARGTATALAALALAHFVWFALALHNPLWSAQMIGTLPVANALLPMYGAGFAALWLCSRVLPEQPAWPRWVHHGIIMAVAAVLAISELRQAFAGTLLTAGLVSQAENLLRSFAGIVLAIGFLLWGTRRGGRSWRIGSLVLMVVAVMKVFALDAAGLQGLARVASFMALGFSLIGIGWFYNCQLRATAANPPVTVT